MTIMATMRRMLLVPIAAVALVLGIGGVASAGPGGAHGWAEVTGEAYFTGFEVLSGPQELGNSGPWRDEINILAEGSLVLADGSTIDLFVDSYAKRTYNQAFYDFFYESDFTAADWDGFIVGTQVATFDTVTCAGPLLVKFDAEYQAPGMANLRCDDGGALKLIYEGDSALMGSGYDQITGAIRR